MQLLRNDKADTVVSSAQAWPKDVRQAEQWAQAQRQQAHKWAQLKTNISIYRVNTVKLGSKYADGTEHCLMNKLK